MSLNFTIMVQIIYKFSKVRKVLFVRHFCSKKRDSAFTAENLRGRSILLVSGKESNSLLHKLIANDISKLDGQNKSIFTIFLNDKGKVLHDAIIYRYKDDYLIEVDSRALQAINIHLKLVKEGRRVDVKNMENVLTVWGVNNEDHSKLEQLKDIHLDDSWITCMDPRIHQLGLRIVGPRKIHVISTLRNSGVPVVQSQKNENQILRYKYGVAQGVSEIPFGRCSPAEMNADYLMGICPRKTDYIGWNPSILNVSWTRRILPLHFQSDVDDSFPVNTPILDEKGVKKTPLGHLCGFTRKFGIALMSVNEALKVTHVRICNKQQNVLANCSKPFWWPLQSTV